MSSPLRPAALPNAAPALAAPPAQRTTAAAKSVTPPRILQSAHSPAQLCFIFKRG